MNTATSSSRAPKLLSIGGLLAGLAVLAAAIAAFLWIFCRVYVPEGCMAVVTAKTGKPLPPGQILAE